MVHAAGLWQITMTKGNEWDHASSRPRTSRRRMDMTSTLSRWASAACVVLVAGSLQAEKAHSDAAPLRWTAATPNEMLDLALRRAGAGGDGAMPGLAVAYALADRASAGRARVGLETLGHG